MDPKTYAGPIVVTCAYVAVYYGMMVIVAKAKFQLAKRYKERGEKFDRYFGQDREMLAADRTQLNMLEHMPPFLVLMWAHAVFVSTSTATIVGGIYVASRMLYPIMLGRKMGRDIRWTILFATGFGYLMVAYFIGTLLHAALA